jgi:nitrous oxidase accessory protein NosD
MRSGAAVTIAADGVTFDLQGFSLAGSIGLGTLADGVAAMGRRNVIVRNGTVRGFLAGVRLTQAAPYTQPQGIVVQGLKALANRYAGIWVEGVGNIVSSSSVSATGRGTAFGPDLDAIGIAAVGPSSQLSGNVIASTFGTGRGTGFGIALKGAAGASVSANRISASRLRTTTGVFADASTGITVTGNQLSSLLFGIVLANGSTGSQSGNVFTGVTNPYVGP